MNNPFAFIFRSNKDLANDGELPDIFPFACTDQAFIESDILATYTKILTDTIERTSGLPDEFEPALWDSCVQSEANKGLITLLAEAMYQKTELFLVYKANVLRKATQEEQALIKKDYEAAASSKTGVYISFKNYRRTEVLKIYSALEYFATAGLHKSVNLSKAVQVKIDSLRASVSLVDADKALVQGKAVATSLRNGKDVLIDGKDTIMTAQVDTGPTEKAIAFINQKRAYILGLPVAYVSGELTAGIGSTGEADMREIERGLKQYFESIVKPVLKALFDATTEFKSQDFRQLSSSLEALRTFDMVTSDLMPDEVKIEIVARLFDQDLEKFKKLIEAAKKAKPKLIPPPNPINQVTQPAPTTTDTQDVQGDGGQGSKAANA